MKNEFPIEIDGKEFVLKPKFSIIKSIEDSNIVNCSVLEFANKAVNGEVKISQLVEVIYLAIKSQKDSPNREAIGDAILEKGMTEYLSKVGEFISCAFVGAEEYARLNSSSDEEGNEDAA